MKSNLIFLFIILLTGCSKSPWVQFNGQGIPEAGESYNDMYFENDSVGYMGGTKSIADHGGFSEVPVFYKTENRGVDWTNIPVEGKGSIYRLFSSNDTVIIINQDLKSDDNYIAKSVDDGKTWRKLLSFDNHHYLREAFFKNPQTATIEIEDNAAKKQLVLTYKSLSKKWDTIKVFPINYYNHKLGYNYIFSLIPTDTQSANSKGVIITSVERKTCRNYLFDKPYLVSSSTIDNKGNYWTAVHDANKSKLIKISPNEVENVDLGNLSNYYIDNLYVYNNRLLLVSHLPQNAGLLGVIHQSLVSDNGGKDWQLENMPSSMIERPAFLYKNEFFITAASPPGFFQLRK